jgi:hypothetical protein
MTDHLSTFAACFAALYAGHHVADYWVQSDHQARHKGDKGPDGIIQCALHCVSLVITQALCLFALLPLGVRFSPLTLALGLLLSMSSHYAADRREYGLIVKLARLIPGKANFLELGAPRYAFVQDADRPDVHIRVDQPTLGTGAWALDQAWHIFFGVFLAALVIAL